MTMDNKMATDGKYKRFLEAIDKRRKLFGQDKGVFIPYQKFCESITDPIDPDEVEILLERAKREDLISLPNRIDKRRGLKIPTLPADPTLYPQEEGLLLNINTQKFDEKLEDLREETAKLLDKDDDYFAWDENCVWIDENTFSCWCGNTLKFYGKDNTRLKCFKPLVENSGKWTETKDIAEVADKNEGEIRTILSQINNERIKTSKSSVSRCFEITPRGNPLQPSAYRLKLLHER